MCAFRRSRVAPSPPWTNPPLRARSTRRCWPRSMQGPPTSSSLLLGAGLPTPPALRAAVSRLQPRGGHRRPCSSTTLSGPTRGTSSVVLRAVLPSVTRRRPRIRSLSLKCLPPRWRRGKKFRPRVGSAVASDAIAAARRLRGPTPAARPRLARSLSMRRRRQAPVDPPRRRTRPVSLGRMTRKDSSRCKAGASGGCVPRVGTHRLAGLRLAHRRSSPLARRCVLPLSSLRTRAGALLVPGTLLPLLG